MRAVDLLGLALAALIALLTMALQPWTPLWGAGIMVAGIIALAAIVHMVLAASGKSTAMNAWAPWMLIIGGPLLGIAWLYFGTSIDQQLLGSVDKSARLVVLGFTFRPIDPSNIDFGYEINLHAKNRGPSYGYAPLLVHSFKSVENQMSAEEIDKEMDAVVALSKLPGNNREQVEEGMEFILALPTGFSREAYLDISTGKKLIYMFVALNYTDGTTRQGQYLVSEFCAWMTKDFSRMTLCRGRNKIWLHQ